LPPPERSTMWWRWCGWWGPSTMRGSLSPSCSLPAGEVHLGRPERWRSGGDGRPRRVTTARGWRLRTRRARLRCCGDAQGERQASPARRGSEGPAPSPRRQGRAGQAPPAVTPTPQPRPPCPEAPSPRRRHPPGLPITAPPPTSPACPSAPPPPASRAASDKTPLIVDGGPTIRTTATPSSISRRAILDDPPRRRNPNPRIALTSSIRGKSLPGGKFLHERSSPTL